MKAAVRHRWWMWLALIALFYGSRAPFLDHPYVGEEGTHANLARIDRPLPDVCIVGRIDGNSLYFAFNHPGPVYWMIGKVGSAVTGWRRAWDVRLSPAAGRVAMSFFQLAIWAALLGVAGRDEATARRRWTLALGAAMALTPLAVGSSIMFQTDGTVGVLGVGALAAALWAAQSRALRGVPMWAALGSAGFLVGLGKHEWSMMWLVAAAVGAAWVLVRGGERRTVAWLAASVAGLAAGNALSYGVDPLDYAGGLRTIVAFTHKAATAAGDPDAGMRRLPYVAPLALLLVYAAPRLWRERSAAPMALWLVAAAIAAPFALSSHSTEYRYFAPALMAALAATAMTLPESPRRADKAFVAGTAVLAVALFAWLAHSYLVGGRSVTLKPGMELKGYFERYEAAAAVGAMYHCVPILPPAMGAFGQGDFLINPLTREDAQTLATERHAVLCP